MNLLDVDPVVDHAGDGDLPCRRGLVLRDGDDRDPVGDGPVVVAEIAVERAVVRGDDRQVGEPLGVHRPDERVVVHDVIAADAS